MHDSWHRGLLATLVAIAMLGCSTVNAPRPQQPTLSLDRQATLERLAHPQVVDWSQGRATSPEVDRLRASLPAAAAKRRVMAVGQVWDASSVSFAGTAASGRISSAPAYAFWTNQCFWITEKGWLLKRDLTTGTTAAWQINTTVPTDTFPSTGLTLSNDGRRAYVCSLQGRFYAVDTTTGTPIAGTPALIGGTNTAVPVPPAPFIDPFQSRDDGQFEEVYTLTQAGTLFHFHVAAQYNTTPSISQVAAISLPMNNTAPNNEVCYGAPIVLNGKAIVGTWVRNTSNSTLDQGSLIDYDVIANSLIRKVALAAPVWATPSIEFDDSLTPVYAFVPTGYIVSMVDLATGNHAESVPLIVNQTTPTSGVLAGYPYGTSGVSSKTLSAITNGSVSVSNNTSRTIPDSGALTDTSNLIASAFYDGTDNTPFFAYTKFYIAASDVVVGGSTRAILDAKLDLNCSNSSNSTGSVACNPVRGFMVSNYLSDHTTLWTGTNVTPTNRPPYEDGAAFGLNTLNSHKSVELVPPGNQYKLNQNYQWSAKGYVAATNAYYSFGLAEDDLPYVNGAGNNGQPHKISAPWFSGGTTPNLILTLSGEGFALPTMSNAIAVDSSTHRIYVLNTNSLYCVNYASPTYDGTATPYDPASFTERATNFGDAAQTAFSLTRLGRDTDSPGSAGPLTTVPSKQYVSNNAPPLFMGSNIYVMDNHPGYKRVSINRFTPGSVPSFAGTPPVLSSGGTAPTLAESFLLPNGGTDALNSSTYMGFDNIASHLFTATYDTTSGSNKGRAWLLSQ